MLGMSLAIVQPDSIRPVSGGIVTLASIQFRASGEKRRRRFYCNQFRGNKTKKVIAKRVHDPRNSGAFVATSLGGAEGPL